MRRALLIVGFWLAAQPAAEAGVRGALADRLARAQAEGTVERTIAVGESRRSYRLHLPAQQPAGPLPLVLDFHGYGFSAAREEALTGFSALADREGFAVAYPQADGKAWRAFGGSDDDLAYLRALLADAATAAAIDPARIYATGISNGAQMTLAAACGLPGTFAAVAFVAGGYPRVCAPPRPPALIFHGTDDRVLAYDGRAGQMPVRGFAAAWGSSPGCVAAPEPRGRTGDARRERWACPGAVAELVTLEGKGHSWPGSDMPARITSRDIDATAEIWAFFRSARGE